MKFAFKHLVVAAAFIANSAASASSGQDWSLTSGSATIAFSANALGAISATATAIRTPTYIPTAVGWPYGGQTNTASLVRARGTLNLTLSGSTTVGDSLTSLQAVNSALNFRHLVFDEATGEAEIRSVYLLNFDFDLATSTIHANVYAGIEAAPSAYSPLTSLGKIAVFGIDPAAVGGETSGLIEIDTPGLDGRATGHASGSFAGPLKINHDAADLIQTALRLNSTPGEYPVDLLQQVNWGTASYSTNWSGTPAVPEPSSHALIGAGMLALWVAARLHRR